METPLSSHRHTILLVDDDGATNEALATLLTSDGYAVATANDGSEALAAVGDDPGVCLILVDYRLPDIDGGTLAARLRVASGGRAGVVLVTGDPEAAAKSRGVVRDVVLKPIDPHTLAPLIARHCGAARQRRP